MKFLVFALMLFVSPCFGQTIFRATPIDLEQNKRIDKLEQEVVELKAARVVNIEVPIVSNAPPMPKPFKETLVSTPSGYGSSGSAPVTNVSYGSTGSSSYTPAYVPYSPPVSYGTTGSSNYSPPQRNCANGACNRSTQRRGLFGWRS